MVFRMGKKMDKKIVLIRRKLIAYLYDKGILTSGTTKFNELVELFLDYNKITRPQNVSYRDMIFQIYDQGGISDVEGYTISVKKPVSAESRKAQYEKELEDKRWAALRLKILERDSRRCQMCDKDTNLQVHHKRYISGRKAWEYPDNLLITVCGKCHSKHHGIKKKKHKD